MNTKPTLSTSTASSAATEDWRHRAQCADPAVDPELFFPISSTGPSLVQAAAALRVCQRCPVQQTCLEWALTTGQDQGIVGGFTEDERRSMKRRASRQRAAAA
jgi:WhiB family redox-sensing transcriptional regulator